MALSLSTKGQVSTIDFLIGFLILIFALVLATSALMSFGESNSFEPVKKRAFLVSEYLMSPGTPIDWNQSTVIIPGILSSQGLDETKYRLLSNSSYEQTKFAVSGSYDWYAYLENATHTLNISGCGVGYPLSTDANCQPQFPVAENLASVRRLIAHNGTILRLVVVVWR